MLHVFQCEITNKQQCEITNRLLNIHPSDFYLSNSSLFGRQVTINSSWPSNSVSNTMITLHYRYQYYNSIK